MGKYRRTRHLSALRQPSVSRKDPSIKHSLIQCDGYWNRAGGGNPGGILPPRLLGRRQGRSPSSRLSFEEVKAVREWGSLSVRREGKCEREGTPGRKK